MDTVFTKLQILPSYAAGFTFIWDVSNSLADPAPWKFTVQEAPSSDGPWEAISPELVNVTAWSDTLVRSVTKDFVLFFRVVLVTPSNTYYSFIKTPYGDLNRREYLIVRDIMRREVLQQDDMSGVNGRLWIRATSGPKCTNCIDPFTGNVSVANCKLCLGVGRLPPYFGPFPVWITFTPTRRNMELKPDGIGLDQPYNWDIRMVGFPYAKDNDIALDIASDKRYIIDGVDHELEIRRIPVIQILYVKELPVSDPFYKWDTAAAGEEGCVLL